MDRHTEHSLKVHILVEGCGRRGGGRGGDALLKSVVLSRADADEGFLYAQLQRARPHGCGHGSACRCRKSHIPMHGGGGVDGWLMLRAFVAPVAHRALWALADADGRLQ